MTASTETASAAVAPPATSLERANHGDRVFKALLMLAALAVPTLLAFLVFEL